MGGKGGDWTAGKPRYPLAALVAAVGCSEAELARMVGLSGSSLVAARERGMVEQAAERYAVRAGLHPFVVWPEMAAHAIAAVEVECEASDCTTRFVPRRRAHRFCSPTCAKRAWRRTPKGRESSRAASLRYHLATRDYQLRQIRAWREANPEAKREQWRRYYARHGAVKNARRVERYRTDPAYRERVLAKQRERDRAKAEARRRARGAMGEAA